LFKRFKDRDADETSADRTPRSLKTGGDAKVCGHGRYEGGRPSWIGVRRLKFPVGRAYRTAGCPPPLFPVFPAKNPVVLGMEF